VAFHPPDGVIHPAAAPGPGNAPYVSRRLPLPSPARTFAVDREGPTPPWAGGGSAALGRALAVGALGGAAVTAALFLRGRVRRLVAPPALHLHATSPRPPEAQDPVSVLIAVRHDKATAVAAVSAALKQVGVDRLDVVVLDEGCPEETRIALRREFGDDARVRILCSAPLPAGWSLRAHRGHQLAVAARGRVLLFAEPCAPLGPHAAAAAAALLREERLDLAVLDSGRPLTSARPSPCSTGSRAQAVDARGDERGRDSGAPAWSRSARDAKAAGPNASGPRLPGLIRHGPNAPCPNPDPAAPSPKACDRSGRTDGKAGGRAGSGGRGRGRLGPTTPPPRSQTCAPPRLQPLYGPPPGGPAETQRSRIGRFTLAIDAEAYWRFGGYRAAAADPDPLALLRAVRRASGRVALADGRQVIPQAVLVEPAPWHSPAERGPCAGETTGSYWLTGSLTSTWGSMWENSAGLAALTDTARRLLSACFK
jgi:hypothetical protein